jgi:hypothetical protein
MQHESKYLFGPLSDNLLLGGASLLTILFFAFFMNVSQKQVDTILIIFLTLSVVINYPHFAQSYMIFYGSFKEKIAPGNLPASLRIRYFAYGIIVPILMAGYFGTFFFINPDPRLLIYSIYAMAFFVGWHYVKQGYGMLILDSVLKKTFFSANQKKLMMINAYVCWLSSFALINSTEKTHNMFGLVYQNPVLPYPDIVQFVSIFAVLISSLPILFIFVEKIFQTRKNAPLCGMMAYITSIYIWLFVGQLNPLFLLAIPTFHSLQYSTVVSKYILNKNRIQNKPKDKSSFLFMNLAANQISLIKFYFYSIVLGCLGFWGASYIFMPFLSPLKGLEDADIFIIMTTVFINIHHYFLDNVLWRKENSDVKNYLFKSS